MMVNEALRCLAEGVVEDESMLDLAMILGTGFPPFRGGLMKSARTIGIETIGSAARDYAATIDARFTPPGSGAATPRPAEARNAL